MENSDETKKQLQKMSAEYLSLHSSHASLVKKHNELQAKYNKLLVESGKAPYVQAFDWTSATDEQAEEEIFKAVEEADNGTVSNVVHRSTDEQKKMLAEQLKMLAAQKKAGPKEKNKNPEDHIEKKQGY